MRVTERFEIVDKIARELQQRYTFTEIDSFVRQFALKPLDSFPTNSKWAYSKAILANASPAVLGQIAEDLGMGALAQVSAQTNPPTLWRDNKWFRLFLSHISKDKEKATRLRECLKIYGIAAFVAHDDIEPTKKWETEIERGLFAMDAFISMHTPGFSKSIWTQQEIGFAIARGVLVIPLRMGEDPTGFLSKHQALSRGNKTAEVIAKEINAIIEGDPRTKEKLLSAGVEAMNYILG
jgi:hypothetical protein